MASSSSTPPPSSSSFVVADTPPLVKPQQQQQQQQSLLLLPNEPPFYHDLHAAYIVQLIADLNQPTSLEGAWTEHLKMSGVYWSLTALSLLRQDTTIQQLLQFGGEKSSNHNNNNSMDHEVSKQQQQQQGILDWLFDCYDARTGGFGGNVGHDGHLLYTLSALQILALANALQDERLQLARPAIIAFITSLQQPNGAFCGDAQAASEIDTRYSYCALQSLALLQALPAKMADAAARYIKKCQNLDGGFGAVVGGESHAGQVFCCVAALAIAGRLDLVQTTSSITTSQRNNTTITPEHEYDSHQLAWWLAERQVDSGGLNGRPEKQADVCYSWWILSSLCILGKLSWIHQDRLAAFILQCQDPDDGGIADRPDDMADVFHTFFGIAGLSLLGHLHRTPADGGDNHHADIQTSFRSIDPIYALPTDVVQRLGLPGQVMVEPGETVPERLLHYNVCYYTDGTQPKDG